MVLFGASSKKRKAEETLQAAEEKQPAVEAKQQAAFAHNDRVLNPIAAEVLTMHVEVRKKTCSARHLLSSAFGHTGGSMMAQMSCNASYVSTKRNICF